MGWLTRNSNTDDNPHADARRSYSLGQHQRNEDNRAGGFLRGRDVHHDSGDGPARHQDAFVRGYRDHGDDDVDWW